MVQRKVNHRSPDPNHFMKIGLAQINTTVGDIPGNQELILSAYQRLIDQGAELVVFPELCVCGYPPLDLLHKRRFVEDCEGSTRAIAERTTVPLLIGSPVRREGDSGNPIFNAAVLCADGAIVGFTAKRLLPTYDVFDERRYFQAGPTTRCMEVRGFRIGVTVCEDVWVGDTETRLYEENPIEDLRHQRPQVLINLSASPWHRRKGRVRHFHLSAAARRLQCPVIYCNAVGGNDELIFDGNSLAIDGKGNCRLRLSSFTSDEGILDTETMQSLPILPADTEENDIAQVYDALTLGLRDYAHKSGFKRAVLGLSGGIDSAVTACIAARALGAENVTGIALPSEISSQHSRDDAASLAHNLGVQFHEVPIAGIVDAVSKATSPLFTGRPPDVTEENIQARARGVVLMAFSNKFGALLLTTGNKSEMAVGYCTLYGDMAGGLAVISDVLKHAVYDLANFINREQEIIPASTITKAPSAELRPDQKDEDSLPPYPVLDRILELYVEMGKSRAEIIEAGFDAEVVQDIARKVDRNEYKRKQAPPGLKITPLAFGIGRRIPIVQHYCG
jgi:NAD+ synthase (glutamine-hydrolysing)